MTRLTEKEIEIVINELRKLREAAESFIHGGDWESDDVAIVRLRAALGLQEIGKGR